MKSDPPLLAVEINSLPRRVRDYIHDLETQADPAGTLWELHYLRETIAALKILISTNSTRRHRPRQSGSDRK